MAPWARDVVARRLPLEAAADAEVDEDEEAAIYKQCNDGAAGASLAALAVIFRAQRHELRELVPCASPPSSGRARAELHVLENE